MLLLVPIAVVVPAHAEDLDIDAYVDELVSMPDNSARIASLGSRLASHAGNPTLTAQLASGLALLSAHPDIPADRLRTVLTLGLDPSPSRRARALEMAGGGTVQAETPPSPAPQPAPSQPAPTPAPPPPKGGVVLRGAPTLGAPSPSGPPPPVPDPATVGLDPKALTAYRKGRVYREFRDRVSVGAYAVPMGRPIPPC